MDWARERTFIDQAFACCFGATTASTYPNFLAVQDRARIRAALGYRRAAEERLFLEQYIDGPIEESVSVALGRQVDRSQIIEIGNLAAKNAWSMIALWGEAANDLAGANEMAVATLTASLRRMFARIGVPLHELAPADPARLGEAAGDWGSYFRQDPRVCVGVIAEGQQAIGAFLARRMLEPTV